MNGCREVHAAFGSYSYCCITHTLGSVEWLGMLAEVKRPTAQARVKPGVIAGVKTGSKAGVKAWVQAGMKAGVQAGVKAIETALLRLNTYTCSGLE